MIFVVEVPHQGEPQAWFAFDGDDFLCKVAASDELDEWAIHDVATPRELLDLVGIQPGSAEAATRCPGITAMADEYGLDTVLYRADYVHEPGSYVPRRTTLEQACEAALKARAGDAAQAHPLRCVRIFWSEPEAVLAIEAKDDPLFTSPGGWRALHALREQLLALDVLADQ